MRVEDLIAIGEHPSQSRDLGENDQSVPEILVHRFRLEELRYFIEAFDLEVREPNDEAEGDNGTSGKEHSETHA